MTNHYRNYVDAQPATKSKNESWEMMISARELRSRAPYLLDTNDRDTVLRIAEALEQRAAQRDGSGR